MINSAACLHHCPNFVRLILHVLLLLQSSIINCKKISWSGRPWSTTSARMSYSSHLAHVKRRLEWMQLDRIALKQKFVFGLDIVVCLLPRGPPFDVLEMLKVMTVANLVCWLKGTNGVAKPGKLDIHPSTGSRILEILRNLPVWIAPLSGLSRSD